MQPPQPTGRPLTPSRRWNSGTVVGNEYTEHAPYYSPSEYTANPQFSNSWTYDGMSPSSAPNTHKSSTGRYKEGSAYNYQPPVVMSGGSAGVHCRA